MDFHMRCPLMFASLFSVLTFVMACGYEDATKAGGAAQVAAISEASRGEAKQIFETRCAACHGPTGRGDGPASAGLSPKPANFATRAFQNGASDEHIEKIIQYGGAAVGKSPAMPSNPDLTSKSEVVSALRVHIRGLAD